MLRFDKGGRAPVWVNPDHIVTFWELDHGTTCIILSIDKRGDPPIEVQEDGDTIAAMIEDSKRRRQ